MKQTTVGTNTLTLNTIPNGILISPRVHKIQVISTMDFAQVL